MVSFSMILSDPNPGFKVTVHLQVEYLKKTRDRAIITIERQ